MNELEEKIIEIMGWSIKDYTYGIGQCFINEFISKCSLSDFEKLKDMEWELSQESVKTLSGTSNELIKDGKIVVPFYNDPD